MSYKPPRTWKAEKLANAFEYHRKPDSWGVGSGMQADWERQGYGLTYEDYWIYVCLVGHKEWWLYHNAHWSDYDVVTGMDVWNELRRLK